MTFSEHSLQGAMNRAGSVDHRLARRHLINEYHRGRLRRDQVCDAHPELLRAARNFGEETKTTCPICAEDKLVLVTYVFGPHLPSHGRCVTQRSEMAQIQRRANTSTGEYTAYVVEACRTCKWHQLLRAVPIVSRARRSA